jgi:hypothetical protein
LAHTIGGVRQDLWMFAALFPDMLSAARPTRCRSHRLLRETYAMARSVPSRLPISSVRCIARRSQSDGKRHHQTQSPTIQANSQPPSAPQKALTKVAVGRCRRPFPTTTRLPTMARMR